MFNANLTYLTYRTIILNIINMGFLAYSAISSKKLLPILEVR